MMMEIAQLLESALANNRSGLRKAAMQTVSKMSPNTTLRELLGSEAGEAVRELTLADFGDALRGGLGRAPVGRRLEVAAPTDKLENAPSASDEERIYREILEALAESPLTIGKLSKAIDVDTDQLRGYLNWMKRMGKVQSSGRARATRYSLT